MADIGTEINSLLQERPAPPGMAPRLLEARKFAYYGKLGFLLVALLYLLVAVAALFSPWWWWRWGMMGFWGSGFVAVCFGIAVVLMVVAAMMVDRMIIALIDAGRMGEARTNALLFAIGAFIIGIVSIGFALIPAILLGIAWLKIEETTAAPPPPPPAYQPQPIPQPVPQPSYGTPPPPGGGYVPPPPPPPGIPPPPPP